MLFITSEACDQAKAEKRHTIQAQDVLKALESLGFEDYHHYVYNYNKLYQEANKQDQDLKKAQEEMKLQYNQQQ